MTINELTENYIVKDTMNGCYKIKVSTTQKHRKFRWRRYVPFFCKNCKEIRFKRWWIESPKRSCNYSYLDYCNEVCSTKDNRIEEYLHEGVLFTIDDVPKRQRTGLNPIKRWIRNNHHNKLFMRDYLAKEENKIKLKAKRKKEWARIKSDPILSVIFAKKKRDWARKNVDKVKASSDKTRAKPEYKAKQKIYKAKRYKENQIEWRIRNFLRSIHINSSISKGNTWSEYGIDIHKIKEHLIKEAEQYGGYDHIRRIYHIDHIIPISLYNIKSYKEDMIACNNFMNLRWLTAEENMSKGCHLRPQDIEVIKKLPKEIYPKSWKGKIPKETINA
jgi:hypothetical protein